MSIGFKNLSIGLYSISGKVSAYMEDSNRISFSCVTRQTCQGKTLDSSNIKFFISRVPVILIFNNRCVRA